MLNKNFRGQFIFTFLLSSLPLAVFAAGSISEAIPCMKTGEPCKLADVLDIIKALNSYIAFTLVPITATLAFLYAGLTMVMGAGNPKEVSKGQDIMTNTIYGMIMVFAAYYIVNLIVSGLAGGTADSKATDFLNK